MAPEGTTREVTCLGLAYRWFNISFTGSIIGLIWAFFEARLLIPLRLFSVVDTGGSHVCTSKKIWRVRIPHSSKKLQNRAVEDGFEIHSYGLIALACLGPVPAQQCPLSHPANSRLKSSVFRRRLQ